MLLVVFFACIFLSIHVAKVALCRYSVTFIFFLLGDYDSVDCNARGLNTEDAMCRSRWRKQIGMIDDYDQCSGRMFLLVPAHPGCPGQFPQSRKTVVCVCVTVMAYNSGAVLPLSKVIIEC